MASAAHAVPIDNSASVNKVNNFFICFCLFIKMLVKIKQLVLKPGGKGTTKKPKSQTVFYKTARKRLFECTRYAYMLSAEERRIGSLTTGRS